MKKFASIKQIVTTSVINVNNTLTMISLRAVTPFYIFGFCLSCMTSAYFYFYTNYIPIMIF